MRLPETIKNRFSWLAKARRPGKQLFWVWIAYQCVKGTLTTIFIWAPLLYVWLSHH